MGGKILPHVDYMMLLCGTGGLVCEGNKCCALPKYFFSVFLTLAVDVKLISFKI